MNYSRLVDKVRQKLNEDTSGGMVGAMTAQDGNTSISYLPGSFTSAKNYLHSLAPLKKQWKLETVDEGENYRLKFENVLDIVVPKTSYDEFHTNVLKVKGLKEVNLMENLMEDINREAEARFKQARQLLLSGLRRKPVINQSIILTNYFLHLFPKSTFQPKGENVLFGLNTYSRDVESALEYIRKLYEGELSQIENLVFALKSGEPLNALPPFKKYEYIVGGTIHSNYQNTLIRFESAVNMSLRPTQIIRIPGSEEMLTELSAIKTVKIAKDSIVPIREFFSTRDLLLVKKILDDEINKEVKQVKK